MANDSINTLDAHSSGSDWCFCPRCATPLSSAIPLDADDKRVRSMCTQCSWVHWDNPLPVVAALIMIHGQILLARNVKWPEGKFGLITGFQERGETPLEGMCREVKEETGLTVVEHEFIGLYPFVERNENLMVWFVQADGDIELNHELAEMRLVPPHRVRPWRRGTGWAVADWLHAQGLPVNFLDE